MDVEFGPLNGGTIVLRVGIGPSDDSPWGPPQVLKPGINQPDDKVIYTFTLNEELIFVTPFFRHGDHCSRMLNGFVYISYTHYAPGFYEKLYDEDFDIIDSTVRFGSHYRDTLAVPIDMTPQCPPHC